VVIVAAAALNDKFLCHISGNIAQCHLAQRATPRMPYPDFDTPPPSIIDGLDGMFDLRERLLLQDTFRLSVSECWTLQW
jgi:hypothetical protein